MLTAFLLHDQQANDLAHKAVLKDMIPMAAIHRAPELEEIEEFHERYSNHGHVHVSYYVSDTVLV